jgi:hypothetical protein
MYLAAILDLFSRFVVGWAISGGQRSTPGRHESYWLKRSRHGRQGWQERQGKKQATAGEETETRGTNEAGQEPAKDSVVAGSSSRIHPAAQSNGNSSHCAPCGIADGTAWHVARGRGDRGRVRCVSRANRGRRARSRAAIGDARAGARFLMSTSSATPSMACGHRSRIASRRLHEPALEFALEPINLTIRLGEALFPNEVKAGTGSFTVDPATFREAQAKSPQGVLTSIVLTGCVGYRYPTSTRRHHTGFIYQLHRDAQPGLVVQLTPDWLFSAPLQPGALTVDTFFFGSPLVD